MFVHASEPVQFSHHEISVRLIANSYKCYQSVLSFCWKILKCLILFMTNLSEVKKSSVSKTVRSKHCKMKV